MVETATLEKWASEEKSSLEWLWLSWVSIDSGELEKAAESLTKAKEMHAEGVLFHLVQGQLFLINDQLEEAADEYRSALAKDSRCVGALKKLFEIALLNQDIEGSQEVFKRISKIDPWFKPTVVEEKPAAREVEIPVAPVVPDLESLALDREENMVEEPDTLEVDLSKGDFELPDFDEEEDLDFDNLVSETLRDESEAFANTGDAEIAEKNATVTNDEMVVNEEDVSSALDDIFGDLGDEPESVELNVNEVADALDTAIASESDLEATEVFKEPENESVIPMTGDDVSATIDALFDEDAFLGGDLEESAEATAVELEGSVDEQISVDSAEELEDVNENFSSTDESLDALFDEGVVVDESITEETISLVEEDEVDFGDGLDVIKSEDEVEALQSDVLTENLDVETLDVADDDFLESEPEAPIASLVEEDLTAEENNELGVDAEEAISGMAGELLEDDIFAKSDDDLQEETVSLSTSEIEESPLSALTLDDELEDLSVEEKVVEAPLFEEEESIAAEGEIAAEPLNEKVQSEDPLAADILDTMDDLFGEESSEEDSSAEAVSEFFNIEETTGDKVEDISTTMDDLNLDEFLEEGEEGDVGVSTPTIAEIYVQQGLYGKAIATYEELLSLDPENTELQSKLAEIRELQSQSDNDSDEGDLENPPRKKIRT